MRAIDANDSGRICLAVVQCNHDLARLRDHVVIRQYMSLFVDDETRSLSFLGHQSVEKIESDRLRCDVYHGTNILAIDTDVVLLFGVERIAASRLADFNLVRMSDPIGQPAATR